MPSKLAESNLRKLPKYDRKLTLNLRNVLAGNRLESPKGSLKTSND